MAHLIGTDEAGYGPNLGPLVISATVWAVADGVRSDGLYGLLGDVVVPRPRDAELDGRRVAMADSKRLYQSGKGLSYLEHGLLAALALLDRRPATWCQLWEALAADAIGARDAIPWYAGYEAPIPLTADRCAVERAAAALCAGFAAAGVRLLDVRSRVVFEPQFNRLVDLYDNKGEALSQTTLALIAEVCRPLPDGPIEVLCDKHGGRNRYQHLLSEHFPERLIECYGESRDRSLYRFGPPERRIQFCFQTKAESHLPAALASMASKYLRELAMEALNAFWSRWVPGLARTAGYPADARRFKADIAPAQAALGIDDRSLWRFR